MDRRVPGDPVAVRLEHGIGLRGQRRVLDPSVREAGGDALVEHGVRRLVDDGAVVGALEVDGVHRARGCELLDEVVTPVARRIELEARRRIARQQLPEHVDRLEALRDDEVHCAGLSAHGIGERALGLAQREVERGALEPPPAVVVERVALERP